MAFLRPAAAAGVFCFLCLSAPHSSVADEAKDLLVVETILRLDQFDLESSEKAQAAVARYLENHWGGERYLDLIRRFQLREEAPGVLRLALERGSEPIGADAVATLSELGKAGLLTEALSAKSPEMAERAAEAMTYSVDPEHLAALSQTVGDPSKPTSIRSAALVALYANRPDRHPELLKAVEGGDISEDLRQPASEILMLSRDPKIRESAQSLFAAGEDAFPSVAELLKRTGDPVKGKAVFATKTCAVCHEAGGVGINFGPGLSEIGDKLGKEALFEAIINPSAGISMGFEGWEVTLKDGTPLLGILEEAEDSVTIKMIGGAARSIAKTDIASKKKLSQSIMYPGLHLMMSPEELVDLVEYLSSLKKEGG